MATPGGLDGGGANSDSSSRPYNLEAIKQQQEARMQQLSNMSEEEMAVLKECNTDSLYRALPMAAGAMFGAGMFMRTGRWSPHPKYGPWPKLIVYGIGGFLLGKAMYVPICRQKILDKIPNSNLAHQILKSRNQGRQDESDPAIEGRQPLMRSGDEQLRPLPPQKTEPGLDDRFRPSINNEVKGEEESKGKRSISYEELRQRNRQEYEENLKKRVEDSKERGDGGSYKDSPFMPQKPWPSPDVRREGRSEPQPGPERRKRTNLWGDVIDD